jgi:hypothetical protein
MYLILFIILGGAAGAYIVIINIADYPAPERLATKLWTVMGASAVVGGGGGWALFGSMLARSDPMPAQPILAAAGTVALGLIVGAAAAIAVGLHVKPQAPRH